jgi:rRNA maturation RNase YbeY
MKIIITNRQKIGRPNIPGIRRLMLFFLRQAQRRNPRRRWGEISLVLTDDAGISRINRLYLDREHVTDVIAVAEPAQPFAGERGDYTGEIFVNVQRAREVGRAQVDRELALYLAHACDHLSGAADATPPARRRMRTRELRWLRAAQTMGLLAELLD